VNGARILALIAVGVLVLLWAALSGPGDAEDVRGWEETERAFSSLADELAAFEPRFDELAAQGLKIDLKTTAQTLRDALANLRSERLELRDDRSIPVGKRLPAYRELVRRSDETLSQLRGLRRSVETRYEFFQASNPLLLSAQRQRDLLAARDDLSAKQSATRDVLAALFAELETRARQAMAVMAQDPSQGAVYAKSVVKDLRELDADQKALLAQVGG